MTQKAKKITAGPSKMDLMLAMFDDYFHSPRTVVFQFENQEASSFKASAQFHISKVEKADRSTGELFNFEGTLSYDNFRTGQTVRGWYNTQHRIGAFHFVN
jgi:hypothetical protein